MPTWAYGGAPSVVNKLLLPKLYGGPNLVARTWRAHGGSFTTNGATPKVPICLDFESILDPQGSILAPLFDSDPHWAAQRT